MATTDRAARLDRADFQGALAAWHLEFAGREDSLDAARELGEIEARWGDALFFAGEAGSAPHYQAAQRALVPLGTSFSQAAENERRMQAYQRLSDKLYAIGPEGIPRTGRPAEPHPSFHRWTPRQTGLAELHRGGDHWRHHQLGELWFDAARGLSPGHPAQAGRACQWSLYFFALYNQAWTAHLPASRWDSDGGAEMEEVQKFATELGARRVESRLPDWVLALLASDWLRAPGAFPDAAPAPEFKALAAILVEACQAAGRQDDARRLLARLA